MVAIAPWLPPWLIRQFRPTVVTLDRAEARPGPGATAAAPVASGAAARPSRIAQSGDTRRSASLRRPLAVRDSLRSSAGRQSPFPRAVQPARRRHGRRQPHPRTAPARPCPAAAGRPRRGHGARLFGCSTHRRPELPPQQGRRGDRQTRDWRGESVGARAWRLLPSIHPAAALRHRAASATEMRPSRPATASAPTRRPTGGWRRDKSRGRARYYPAPARTAPDAMRDGSAGARLARNPIASLRESRRLLPHPPTRKNHGLADAPHAHYADCR